MPAPLPWSEANQRHLLAALAELRAVLQIPEAAAKKTTKAKALPAMERPAALDRLVALFSLSAFERSLLLLCAGVELDPDIAALCASRNEGRRANATWAFAQAALPDPHWSAIAPDAALRHWRLIEVGAGDTLASSPLRVDERVLHYLTGVASRDERLAPLLHAVAPQELPPSQQRVAQELAQAIVTDAGTCFHLTGGHAETHRSLAATTCAALGLRLQRLCARDLPHTAAERFALARLWEREALLTESALLLDAEDEAPSALASFVDAVRGVVFLSGAEGLRLARPCVPVEITLSDPQEQERLWRESLGPVAPLLNGQVEAVAAHFHLPPSAIRAASAETVRRLSAQPDRAVGQTLWETCRVHARQPLDGLVQRIEPMATWDDLVLPVEQLHTLRQIAAQVRQRSRVLDAGGFAQQGARGLGLCALFSGPSGTGKTMAAEVLARELGLDLHHLNVSAVTSKYVGDTSKNIRRAFATAQASGAILLCDECDALFGKRSEVRDSHDRYANNDVSDLLQCIEAYRGLIILTTNMKASLDTAFQRRLRFKIEFAFPDATQRARLWQRVFPVQTPTRDLDYEKLARLNLAGGHIRNVALNAAFLAADEAQPVTMKHLLMAAHSEYAKLDKTLAPSETGGWV